MGQAENSVVNWGSNINSSHAYRKIKDFLTGKIKDVIAENREGMTKHNIISMDRFEPGNARIADLYRFCSNKQMNKAIFDYAEYLKKY